MRQMDTPRGILSNFNDLLGRMTGSDFAITPWSIQGAMAENFKRIVKSFIGNNPNGRVGWGLDLSQNGYVAEGVGYTMNGDIVYWPGGTAPLQTSDGDHKLYLNKTNKRYSTDDGGKTLELVSQVAHQVGGSVDVVVDSSDDASEAFSSALNSGDSILVAEYTVSNGVVTNIKNLEEGVGRQSITGWTGTYDPTTHRLIVENGIITGTESI